MGTSINGGYGVPSSGESPFNKKEIDHNAIIDLGLSYLEGKTSSSLSLSGLTLQEQKIGIELGKSWSQNVREIAKRTDKEEKKDYKIWAREELSRIMNLELHEDKELSP